MVKEFKMQGRVTLDRVELTRAIKDYVLTKEQLITQKFRWLDDGSVVLDVWSKNMNRPPIRKNVILNRGFFPMVRKYLAGVLKSKASITFGEVWEIVKVEFPAMDEKRLNIYLHDKRQLPDIDYDSTAKIIYRRHKK